MAGVLVGQRPEILHSRNKEPIPSLMGRADQMQSSWVQRALGSPAPFGPNRRAPLARSAKGGLRGTTPPPLFCRSVAWGQEETPFFQINPEAFGEKRPQKLL